MRQPVFSVIIPARNEAENIAATIKSIKSNDIQKNPYEIIVVDDASTDETAQLALTLGAKVIRGDKKADTIAALRNRGACVAAGDVLIFIDADMVVPSDIFECVWGYFSTGFKGVVGFSLTVPQEAGWVGRAWADRGGHGYFRTKDVDYLPGGNIFINREVFEEIGGFTETLRAGEDKDMTFKAKAAGYRVVYSPERSVIHMGFEKGLAEFIRKEFWRQGQTLGLAARWGYSMRALRNPVLSLYHLTALLAVPVSLFFLKFYLVLVAVWVGPSVLIVLKDVDFKRPTETMEVLALTFIRWNVAAIALVFQLARPLFAARRAPL
ncbi:MAG: glycosyltransferase [Deltaproteobacteria bacterium]|nr:glycosyltransferase [Deltaproteobacteria bacterium]